MSEKTRVEEILTAVINGETIEFEPKTRLEQYLKNYINKSGVEGLPEPQTRLDALLHQVVGNPPGGGGNIEPLIITANGTYEATEKINGYAPITVAVASGEEIDPADATKKLIDLFESSQELFKGKNQNSDVDKILSCLRYDVTENSQNASYMFSMCTELTEVPLLNLKKLKSYSISSSSAGGADYMFEKCYKLVNVPQFDFSNIDVLKFTFDHCNALIFPEWITDYEGSMISVFRYCHFPNQTFKNKTFKCNYANGVFANAFSLLADKNLENIHFINTTDCSGIFKSCFGEKLLNCSFKGSLKNGFEQSKFNEITNIIIDDCVSLYYGFRYCTELTKVSLTGTEDCQSFQACFYMCNKLVEVSTLDLREAWRTTTVLTDMFRECSALEKISLKNIKMNLQVGSGTSWGHLLTVDSLVNTIYELYDMELSRTLTVGSANLEKLASVYVKLVDITDEMRAEDDLIDNKLPFVVCESTDEGAMLITEYATLKSWSIV